MSAGRLSNEDVAAVRALAREVRASRKLVADLRALHVRANEMPDYCAACTRIYPCPTIRMIDEAGL